MRLASEPRYLQLPKLAARSKKVRNTAVDILTWSRYSICTPKIKILGQRIQKLEHKQTRTNSLSQTKNVTKFQLQKSQAVLSAYLHTKKRNTEHFKK